MNKIIDNIKSGNYEVVDNQGVSVTGHFTQCLEKEFADLEAKLAEKDKEIKQLKQQLRNLPKKIVEDFYDEIRHRAILEDDYCPDHNLERKYGVRKCLLEDIRTTILKKYGGEDE